MQYGIKFYMRDQWTRESVYSDVIKRDRDFLEFSKSKNEIISFILDGQCLISVDHIIMIEKTEVEE